MARVDRVRSGPVRQPGQAVTPTLEAVLATSPHAVALLQAVRDAHGSISDMRVLVANDRMCEYLGLPPDQVVGHLVTDIGVPTDPDPIAVLAGVLTGGEHFVWRGLESVTGPRRVVDVQCHRVDDDCLSVMVSDVTDRSRAEDLLLEREFLFRSAMESSPIGMCLISPDGGFLHVNQALCTFLGRDERTLRSTTWQQMTHPDDLAADVELAAAVIAGTSDGYRLTKRYVLPDGSISWGDLAVRGIRNPDGSVKHFIAQIVDETARHRAEQALAASQEQFRMLAENASDLVFRSDADMTLTWVSPSVEQVLGWGIDDLLGTRVIDLVHPEDLDTVRDAIHRAEPGRPVTYRGRLRRRDGGWKWLAVTARPILDESGRLTGQIGSGRDVDAEQSTAQALSEERDYLAAVIDSELDARVLLAPVRDERGEVVDLTYLDLNPMAVAALGIAEEQMLGARMLELFPGQKTTGLFDRYVHTLITGEPLIADEVESIIESTGAVHWLDLRAVRVRDTLSITWRDVSDRHQMSDALERSEQRFRLMAMNTSDIVRVANAAGVMEWVSPSLTKSLGWQPDDWIGHRLSEFVHPLDVPDARIGRSEVLDGHEATMRLRIRDAEGGYHWVESRGAPFRDEAGDVRGMVAAMSIIDERVAVEEALQHQASHDPLTGLLTREEAYRQLSSMLSHEPGTGTRMFVAFTDLDNLKQVNDEYGHTAGDALLRVVAHRTSTLLREGDLIARVGGDELLLILPGIQSTQSVIALMHRLLAVVNSPHGERGVHLLPRMSIGLTEVQGQEDIEQAVHRADTAMYAAKAKGGNQVVLG